MNNNDENEQINKDSIDKIVDFEVKKKPIDVKRILSILGFILIGIGFVGTYFYAKSHNKKIEETQDASIAKPIEASKTALDYGVPPPNMPEATPAVQVVQPMPVAQGNNDQLSKEEAMRLAREKSSLVIKGGNSISVGSPDNGDKKNVAPELQSIFGALANNGTGGNQQKTGFGENGQWSGQQQMAPSSANYIAQRDYKMLQGRVIPAVTINAVKSNAQCYMMAQVSRNVYGEQGRIALLPAGTRLFGECQSLISNGQTEMAVIWNRAVTPNGVEIQLDSPVTNGIGVVGMGGKVNNHFMQNFGTAALLSLIGTGTATVGVNGSDNNNSASQYRSSVAQAMNQSAQSTLSRYGNVPPTIEVPAAQNIFVLLRKDLDFTTLFGN